MADTRVLAVIINVSAASTVSGDVGDVDMSSTHPRALSCQVVRQMPWNRSRWAREAAQLGQVKTEPAPVHVP